MIPTTPPDGIRKGRSRARLVETGQVPPHYFKGLVADCRVSSKCDVRKPWKTIVGFALLGLAIAALSYAYAAFDDYTKPMNGLRFAVWTVSMILCPPQLLFTFSIDCDFL